MEYGEGVQVIFHEDFYQVYAHDPAAEAGRMEAVVEVLRQQVEFVTAEAARPEDIAAVHTRRHIDSIRRQGLYDIAALAAGGAIQAARRGLEEPTFALIRPPGHHASADSAWGFCFFNNMAVALTHLKKAGLIESAYVLDIDLHFGDGTVNILHGQDWVRVHNVAAHERTGYIREVLGEMKDCRADIIGISAGFDNHAQDWGGVLETGDYQAIGECVRDACLRSGGGCFAVLEGGYNHRVLGHNVLALIKGLSAQP